MSVTPEELQAHREHTASRVFGPERSAEPVCSLDLTEVETVLAWWARLDFTAGAPEDHEVHLQRKLADVWDRELI